MIIFASILLGILWVISAILFGYGTGTKNEGLCRGSIIMAIVLGITTVSFIGNLTNHPLN